LKFVPIERVCLRDEPKRIAEMFDSGDLHPCIVTDAAAEWPARDKWTLDFFALRYGSEVGVAPLGFTVRATPGKATLLGAFIEHLGEPYDALPGVWVGTEGKPPEFDEARVWSFSWEPFRNHPALFDDIAPFPAAVPNMTASLPRDVYDALESIQRRNFNAIYISRSNTVTPLHSDWHHTFGCLVQFEGRKKVILLPSGTDEGLDHREFDPENPDEHRWPAIRDVTPHYTRSEDHSITLSHNFFNLVNFDAYMRCVREDAATAPDKARLFEEIRPQFARDS
jgi:hypothetical protein